MLTLKTGGESSSSSTVSAVYLKKLEAGERTSPSLPALAAIAKALGATLRIELMERGSTRKRRG